jgi:hypothetical protein
MTDAVVDALVAEASADEGSVGLLLTGSRSVGLDDETSDYDVVWVLTDAAFADRAPVQYQRPFDDRPHADIAFSSPRLLADVAANPGWRTPGLASARILLDKTGKGMSWTSDCSGFFGPATRRCSASSRNESSS